MRLPKHTLSPEHARALLEVAKKPRHKALVCLLWRAGLRNEEACEVRGEDLLPTSSGASIVHIRDGKGGKRRTVALDREASPMVLACVGEPSATILRTGTGKTVNTSTVRRIIKERARDAKIPYRVHPHALRHRYALDLHAKGLSVREIQIMLGHARLDTTQIYLQVDETETLHRALDLSWD
jgi:integrase/recombinase XerD